MNITLIKQPCLKALSLFSSRHLLRRTALLTASLGLVLPLTEARAQDGPPLTAHFLLEGDILSTTLLASPTQRVRQDVQINGLLATFKPVAIAVRPQTQGLMRWRSIPAITLLNCFSSHLKRGVPPKWEQLLV